MFKTSTLAYSLIALFFTLPCQPVKAANADLSPETVASMSCPKALDALKERVQLNQQFATAYLATFQTLNDVYTVWGEKLSTMKSLDDAVNAGAFFKSSAKFTKDAIDQSTKVVDSLNNETNLLMTKVNECLQAKPQS